MSKIVVDQVQKSGGTAFTLPTVDGSSGQFMATDGAGNLGFASPNIPSIPTWLPLAPEGKGIVGSVVSSTQRNNIYSTPEWSSTGPSGSNFTNNALHQDPNMIQFMTMLLGDGLSNAGTSQGYLGDSEGALNRQLQFSNGNRLGYRRDQFYYDNATSYGGHSWRVMPIRNTSNAGISVALAGYTSDYWSAGYEGSQLLVIAPNTSTYSTVTSVTGTSIGTTSNSSEQNALTGNFTVPANTTVLVVLSNTHSYQTTYRFKDTNYFYNLGTTFTSSSIICDMRMLSSLYMSRFNLTYTASGLTELAKLWTVTATNFGDR